MVYSHGDDAFQAMWDAIDNVLHFLVLISLGEVKSLDGNIYIGTRYNWQKNP